MKKNITIINVITNEKIDFAKFTVTFVGTDWVRGYYNTHKGFTIVFAPFNGYKVIVEN